MKGDPGGSIVFTEQHATRTNDFGMYTLVIGEGQGNDQLKDIDWASAEFFIETMITVDGGDEMSSISKLNAVPYSFMAYKSVVDETKDDDSDITNEIQNLSLNGTQLSISKGNEVDLSELLSTNSDVVTTLNLNADGRSIDYVDEVGTTTNLNLCNVVDNCCLLYTSPSPRDA